MFFKDILSKHHKKVLDYLAERSYNNFQTLWRSRVVGRARTIGNRVTIKSGSRVRIPPSPPKQKPPSRVVFCFGGEGALDKNLFCLWAKQFVVAVRNVR